MTEVYMSHHKLIFKPKSKIWPQMTPSRRILSKLLFQRSLKLTESIDYKQNKFWSQGRQQTAPKFEFSNKKTAFLINSRIQKFSLIIIFGGAWSPGGVRLSIRPVWSLTLPVMFEILQYFK